MADDPRVLLIEDDATIRHVVVEALHDEGFVVREASDGLAALAVLEHWRPSLIVLDLMMPGMDGHQFRAEQRRRGLAPEIPVILLSASRSAREAASVLGAVAVVAKPFDLVDLMRAVTQIGQRTPEPAPPGI
jgi:CheY-like chemotaxis protein